MSLGNLDLVGSGFSMRGLRTEIAGEYIREYGIHLYILRRSDQCIQTAVKQFLTVEQRKAIVVVWSRGYER